MNLPQTIEAARNVQCLRCAKFSLQDVSDEWRRQGFGNCEHREKFIVFGARRERGCVTFAAAEADVVAKRDAWLRERAL